MHVRCAIVVAGLLAMASCTSNDKQDPATLTGGDAKVDTAGDSQSATDDALASTDHDTALGDADQPPEGWTCAPAYFTDSTCDCGCGIADTAACTEGCTVPGCQAPDCDYCYDVEGAMTPCTPPTGWLCDTAAWNDWFCDCGCGLPDRGCDFGGCVDAGCIAIECRTCHGAAAAAISCAPETWACNVAFYTDASCDCGCGLPDLGCNGAGCIEAGCNATACEWCFDGSQSQECP